MRGHGLVNAPCHPTSQSRPRASRTARPTRAQSRPNGAVPPMQRIPHGSRVSVDNRLIKTWCLPDGRRVTQGKRVAADCPLTRDEIRAYVDGKGNSVAAIKAIRAGRGIGLAAAFDLLKAACGPGEVV